MVYMKLITGKIKSESNRQLTTCCRNAVPLQQRDWFGRKDNDLLDNDTDAELHLISQNKQRIQRIDIVSVCTMLNGKRTIHQIKWEVSQWNCTARSMLIYITKATFSMVNTRLPDLLYRASRPVSQWIDVINIKYKTNYNTNWQCQRGERQTSWFCF